MLLLTTVGLVVVGYLIYLIGCKVHSWNAENVGGGMIAIFSLILAFMLIAMAITSIGADANFAKEQAHREFLVAQYKTGIYDESVFSQYNLLQQIDEWNCGLAKMQKLTNDEWVGIFVPDYWDKLDYITVNLFGDVTEGGDR